MTHANTSPKSRSFLVLTGAVLTVAFLIGGAFYTRGPDLIFAPQMAEAPVILADGSALHVQKYEVTVVEWNKCHMAGGCSLALRATGSHTEAEMPATGLSFMDVAAMSYLVRDPARGGCAIGTPPTHLGMRLVSDQAS